MRADILHGIYDHDNEIPDDLQQLEREQGVKLPYGTESVIGQIFSQRETDAGKGTGGYTERIAAAGQGWAASSGGQFSINTFPFGEKTTGVFPEFLGVCADKTTLNATLNGVKGYCEQVRKSLPLDDEKTVVLLTDKWDGPLFHKKYEMDFLRYSLNNNILFIFLLVTDYGVSRIPFLCKNRKELIDLIRRRIVIEDVNPEDETLALLREHYPCRYMEEQNVQNSTGGPNSRYLLYEFYFGSLRCEVTDGGIGRQVKKFSVAAARRFADSVREFYGQQPQQYADPSCSGNGSRRRAQIFDAEFDWKAVPDDKLEQPCQKVAIAFRKLIASLKDVRK
jgi:hypothetical protein